MKKLVEIAVAAFFNVYESQNQKDVRVKHWSLLIVWLCACGLRSSTMHHGASDVGAPSENYQNSPSCLLLDTYHCHLSLSFFHYFLFFFNLFGCPRSWLQHTESLIFVAESLVVWIMWDLVPREGIEPRPTALGAQSLSHWTTSEVLALF